LTPEGLADLKRELNELKEEKRPQIVERLAVARDQGELAENQEYSRAKEDLTMIDGKISELEEVIGNAVMIDQGVKEGPADEVYLGCRVTVELEGQEIIFHLVGEWEADPASQKVSDKSPLGQKLIGKKPGETIEVEAPIGKLVYKIVNIE
jgi:transcription elongation factor GreA